MGSAVVVSMCIGLAAAVQAAILGKAASELRTLSISLGLLLAGLVVAAAWATTQRAWGDVAETVSQWWWLPLGVLGWLIVGALGYSSARIGVAATLGMAVATQLAVGLAIDVHRDTIALGVRPLVGLGLLALGVVMLVGATH